MQRLILKHSDPSESVEDPLQTASVKELHCVIFNEKNVNVFLEIQAAYQVDTKNPCSEVLSMCKGKVVSKFQAPESVDAFLCYSTAAFL